MRLSAISLQQINGTTRFLRNSMAALDYNPASAASADAQTLMLQHESRQDPPSIHPQAVTLAFEAQQWPELVKKIASPDNVIVNKALVVALSYLPQPLEVAKASKAGVFDALTGQAVSSDSQIRTKVAGCLRMLLGDRAVGHSAAAEHSHCLEAVKGLSCDPDEATRLISYEAIHNLSLSFGGAAALVSAGFVPHLVERITAEERCDAHRQLTAALARCVNAHGQQGVKAALDGDCVRVCTAQLQQQAKASTPDEAVMSGCASVLMYAAVPPTGKQQLIEQGTIPVLLAVLQHSAVRSSAPIAAACGALMNVLINDDAKRETIKCGAEPVLTRLQDAVQAYKQAGSDMAVVLNALRALAALAAHPTGRQLALQGGLLSLIDEHIIPAAKTASNSTMERLAAKTRAVVDWRP